MVNINIDLDACRGCEMCVEICPVDVYTFDQESAKAAVAIPENCIACLSCVYLCPSEAIEMEDFHVVKNFYRDIEFSRRMEKFL